MEFLFFFILIVWTLYIGVGFFKMIEKHRMLYDDNVDDSFKDSIYLEKV